MQLLYERSFENGDYQGLGLIPGDVVKLKQMPKIPHMGWNSLDLKRADPLLKYIRSGDYVYFVHSYYARSDGEEIPSPRPNMARPSPPSSAGATSSVFSSIPRNPRIPVSASSMFALKEVIA